MEAKASVRKVRISPDKARLVINLIRHKKVNEALDILSNLNKKAAPIIKKLLISAMANATNNLNLKAEEMYIKACYVDEGKTLKRFSIHAKGRVGKKDRNYSHITIILAEGENIRRSTDGAKG